MGWDRLVGRSSRIVLVVIVEYLLFVGVLFLAIRYLGAGAARTASAAAVLFGALTLINFGIAHRLLGDRPPRGLVLSLGRLREDIRFLRWYVDDVLDRVGVGVLVLDPTLRVRSVNPVAADILSVPWRSDLVGRSFRSHPLAAGVSSRAHAGSAEPLLRVLERSGRGAEGRTFEAVRYDAEGRETAWLDIAVHPWPGGKGGPVRLIVTLDRRPAPAPVAEAPAKTEAPRPAETEKTRAALDECAVLRDYLRAMIASSRSVRRAVTCGRERPPEAQLLEMQAERALEILAAVENRLR